MDTLTCKFCHATSSVTSYSRLIRCHGCHRTISSANIEPTINPNSLRRLKSHEDISSSIDDEQQEETYFDSSSRRSKCLNFLRRPSRIDSIKSFAPPPKGKRAVLCGVSYRRNKNSKLKGTSNDVINIRNLLSLKFGFPDNSFLILGENEQYQQPTRRNIMEAFKWLVKDIQSGDSLVFYYSGHGLRQLNLDEDEIDGFDEAICPLDYQTSGLIIDNEINQMIVSPLIQGVTLHAIVDTCHSGTLLDLPYVYNKNKGIWDPPLGVSKGTSGGQAICISACEDYQLAADTSMFSPDKTMGGALTNTFINAIKQKQEITYSELLDSVHNGIQEANNYISRGIRRLFHRQMIQDPILSASTPFNIDKVFTL